MGAYEFFDFSTGTNLRESFREAVSSAQWDCGHAGYTGTIAEKDEVRHIDVGTIFTKDQAEERAIQLIEMRDDRVIDKWGPAGALRVIETDGSGETTFDGWLFFGVASS